MFGVSKPALLLRATGRFLGSLHIGMKISHLSYPYKLLPGMRYYRHWLDFMMLSAQDTSWNENSTYRACVEGEAKGSYFVISTCVSVVLLICRWEAGGFSHDHHNGTEKDLLVYLTVKHPASVGELESD